MSDTTTSTLAPDGEINAECNNTLVSNFFDDIVMVAPACRRDKPECESCAG